MARRAEVTDEARQSAYRGRPTVGTLLARDGVAPYDVDELTTRHQRLQLPIRVVSLRLGQVREDALTQGVRCVVGAARDEIALTLS